MNETFGEIFKLPQPSIRDETAVVPGLDGAKMSKSYNNTIEIFAPEAALRKKIMGIKTDCTPVESPKPVEGSVILDLYKLVASPGDFQSMLAAFHNGGTGYGDLKKQLFAGIWEYFAPFRVRREQILADASLVDRVLADGAAKAREVSDRVMKRVRAAVGIGEC
jgi:tryptophanyl-tRNA synthetase